MKLTAEKALTILEATERLTKEYKFTDIETNLLIGKNLLSLRQLRQAQGETVRSLVDKYVRKDEMGREILVGNPSTKTAEFDFESKEHRDAYIKEKTDARSKEIEVDISMIAMSAIKKDTPNMSGDLLADLMDIIDTKK